MNATFTTVTSADGTQIAYDQAGDGPPVILIGGAFNDRTTVAGLAAVLAAELTAVGYDRRGRGDSGDSADYAVEREVEDLVALIGQVGGSASVFGHSSGAVLALEAAERGAPISRLAVYEPPYIADGSRHHPPADLADQVRTLIGEDRRDEAVTLFLTESVGVPAEMVQGMRASDTWGWLVGLARTLPYDLTLCGPGNALPADRLAKIEVPTLAIGGSLSPPWLPAGARAVAAAIPGARYETLEGQDHGVLNQPEALRPLLLDFLS
jgi:pimeloyl-ACP methyl ester carboxylesterase